MQSEYRSADVLRLAAIDPPTIADDEVLVRVHAAALDPGTRHLMAGEAYLIASWATDCADPGTLFRASTSPAPSRRRTLVRAGNRRHAVLGPAPGTYVLED